MKYELGDRVALSVDITAVVIGWRKMLGGPMEFCLSWWEGRQMVEQWMNATFIEETTERLSEN